MENDQLSFTDRINMLMHARIDLFMAERKQRGGLAVDPAKAKMVLMILANWDVCFKGHKRIVQESGCSTATITRVQKILEELGVIELRRRSYQSPEYNTHTGKREPTTTVKRVDWRRLGEILAPFKVADESKSNPDIELDPAISVTAESDKPCNQRDGRDGGSAVRVTGGLPSGRQQGCCQGDGYTQKTQERELKSDLGGEIDSIPGLGDLGVSDRTLAGQLARAGVPPGNVIALIEHHGSGYAKITPHGLLRLLGFSDTDASGIAVSYKPDRVFAVVDHVVGQVREGRKAKKSLPAWVRHCLDQKSGEGEVTESGKFAKRIRSIRDQKRPHRRAAG